MPNLEVQFREGVAYATGSIAGERIRRSLKTRDPARAAELCALLEAKLWKRSAYGEEAIRTFEEAAVAYQKAGGEGLYLPPIIRHFKGRVLGSIKPEEVRQAARSIYPDGRGSTWNRQGIVPARAVINHGAGLGWCQAITVQSFPVEKSRRKAASRAWMDAFLKQADADKLPHTAAAVLFMHQNGPRASEVIRVMPEHVDLKARTIELERTKESEWEVRHLTLELVIRLANLPMRKGWPVFRYASRFGLYRRMRAICRRAGIEWHPPHEAGRHSYATNALARGATPKQVMEGGGWKTARLVLETYAHADDGGKAIAAIFDAEAGSIPPQSKSARLVKDGKKTQNRKR